MGEVKGGELARRYQAMTKLNGRIKRDWIFSNVRSGTGNLEKRMVPGDGSMNPKAVFVLEHPGRDENALCRPLLGEAGSVFDGLLNSVGLTRPEVYVTYAVKWWPTTSDGRLRKPTPEERTIGRYDLIQELSILEAWRFVALGQRMARMFLPDVHERGRWHPAPGLPFRVLPLMHPVVGFYQQSLRPMMAYEFRSSMGSPNATQ